MRTLLLSAVILSASLGADLQAQTLIATPRSVVDTALARMGGAEAVARVQRVRREMLTTWQRTNFRDEPYADAPSYELHTDIRDYGRLAWRNTRKFGFSASAAQIIDIVVDTIAIRQMPTGAWTALNVAYVDERRELFAFAPERILLLARDARDLRAGRDTTIDLEPVARLTATIEGFPTTLFFRRGDGLLAMVRYRAAQVNDFGLTPWGTMEVEQWYSRWAKTPVGASLPTQWDIRRVRRPYKRVTVLSAAYDTVVSAETFAISDSLRGVYLATATKPMHDVAVDSARFLDPNFAVFGAPGSPVGAVKLGGRWILIEAGQGGLSAERALGWLGRNDSLTPVGAAVLTMTSTGNGGITEVARRRLASYTAPGATPFVQRMIGNIGVAGIAPTTITAAQWLKVGTDSLWLEPIDLPDAPRSMLVYSPTHRWLYSALAAAPLQLDYLLARVRERGWVVERIGSGRGIAMPVPPAR
jgi:hypothetical protein